jgi:Na+-driven multidrug efflux pump
VYTVVCNIVVGIVLGGQPIFGYNYGAGNMKRVRQTYRLALRASLIVGCVAVAIFELCPQVIIRLFGDGGALYHDFAVKTFRIYLGLTMITCLVKLTSIFFQAIGKPVRAMLASLVREVLCFVTLALLLPYLLERANPGTGIFGVLIAAPISDVVALAVILSLTIPFFRQMKKAERAAS